jgi:hypothetical protein
LSSHFFHLSTPTALIESFLNRLWFVPYLMLCSHPSTPVFSPSFASARTDAHLSLLLLFLLLIFPKQHSLVASLFSPRGFAPVAFHPAVRTVELAIAANAAQHRVVGADAAPGFDLGVGVGCRVCFEI